MLLLVTRAKSLAGQESIVAFAVTMFATRMAEVEGRRTEADVGMTRSIWDGLWLWIGRLDQQDSAASFVTTVVFVHKTSVRVRWLSVTTVVTLWSRRTTGYGHVFPSCIRRAAQFFGLERCGTARVLPTSF